MIFLHASWFCLSRPTIRSPRTKPFPLAPVPLEINRLFHRACPSCPDYYDENNGWTYRLRTMWVIEKKYKGNIPSPQGIGKLREACPGEIRNLSMFQAKSQMENTEI